MPGVAERIQVSESGYEFPVEDILTGRGAIFGKSGSGKSNTATVIIEELLEEGLPLLIVDQDGEYHGLTDEFDDVLHYGADADCDRQVGVDEGDQIADIALTENIPIVLDVSGYMEEETARELVENVVRRLFQRENDIQKPFLLLVEEVHEYVPQQGGLDDLGDMLIRIAKRGRKRGLGICGISQRPASVDKDFITQCDWIVWHRLTWDNDTKVVGRILGTEYSERVQKLGNGEAYVMADWSESIRQVRFRLKHSADAGATPGLEEFRELSGPEPSEPPDDPDAGSATDETDTEIYEAEPDEAPVASPDGAPAGRRRARGGGPPPEPDSSESTSMPRPPEPTEAHAENPVWEFGQMLLYLFTVFGHLLRRLFRAVNPLQSRRPRRRDPLSSNRYTAANWRRVALVLLLVALVLLGVLVALLARQSGWV